MDGTLSIVLCRCCAVMLCLLVTGAKPTSAQLRLELIKMMHGTLPKNERVSQTDGIAAAAAIASTQAKANSTDKETRMQEWVRANKNQNTRRTYESGWKGFQRYLEAEGRAESAIRPADMADYLRERMKSGVAAATLVSDRASIADHLKYDVRLANLHLHPLVADTLRICCNKGAQSKPKQHMSAELLQEILHQHERVDTDNWIAERNVALFLFMMLGFLRESEAVELRIEDVQINDAADTPSSSNSGMGLQSAVVVAAAAGQYGGSSTGSAALKFTSNVATGRLVILHIRQSKTDQSKKGEYVSIAVNIANPIMCPERRLLRYMRARKLAGISSEFLFPKKDGLALAKTTPCSLLQKAVESVNTYAAAQGEVELKWGAPDSYGSHSLRRGGVTEARRSGADMVEIQRHGRWKSLAVYGYIGPTEQQKLSVTRNLFAVSPPKQRCFGAVYRDLSTEEKYNEYCRQSIAAAAAVAAGAPRPSITAETMYYQPISPQKSVKLLSLKKQISPSKRKLEADQRRAEQDEEALQEAMQMEEWQQGHREEDKEITSAASTPPRQIKRKRAATVSKQVADPATAEVAETAVPTHAHASLAYTDGRRCTRSQLAIRSTDRLDHTKK